MKDFIRDDGEVRLCTSNFAKMNIFEFMWYRKEEWFIDGFKFVLKQFKESLFLMVTAIINFICLVLAPVSFPISAWLQIRQAKKEMEVYEDSSMKKMIDEGKI